MKRRSFCEWIPILPWPVWPLAWQRVLGQNTVVGSMTLLLAMRGNIVTRSMSGPPFALQLHCTTVWCRGTLCRGPDLMKKQCVVDSTQLQNRCLLRPRIFHLPAAYPRIDLALLIQTDPQRFWITGRLSSVYHR